MERLGGLGKSGSVASLHRRAAASLVVLTLGTAWAAPVLADLLPNATGTAPASEEFGETAKGHGAMSIAYGNTYVSGFHVNDSLVVPMGDVRSQRIDLDIDYFVADRWSVHAGIPYIDNRYTGAHPHCPTAAPAQCANIPVLTHPHPESQFLDDGNYHGAFQDYSLGAAYHANINNYLITPSITAYIPSHNYTFFANAAVGQDLQRVELNLNVAHQFDFSNIYYRVGFGRVFSEKTFGQGIDYNKLDLEAGYFLNEQWTLKLFGTAKKGGGYFGGYDPTTEVWFHHDQRAPHEYASLGLGADYHLGDKYTLSSALQREIWGVLIFDFKYAFELRLTREF